MKTLNQLISFLIIFQLCFACNGGSSSGSAVSVGNGSSSSGTINFNGSLAKAFNTIGSFLIDSAVAQEGEINVIDISNPSNPQSLGTFDVDDETQGFSFKLPASKVSGRIIELEYIGGGKSIIGKRNLIVPVDGSSSKVDLPTIDESETLNAKLLKAQILSEQITDVSEFKNRMKKFAENRNVIHEIMGSVSVNSSNLLKHIEATPSSDLIVVIGQAFAARIDSSDEIFQKKSIDEILTVASKEGADIFKSDSGFDFSPIISFQPKDGESLEEMVQRFFETFRSIKDNGATYINEQIQKGGLPEYDGRKIHYTSLMEGLDELNIRWVYLNEKFNSTPFQINISTMRGLRCDTSESFEVFNQNLQEATQITYETYINKYMDHPERDTSDYWSQYHYFKQYHGLIYEACELYFKLVDSNSIVSEIVASDSSELVEKKEAEVAMDSKTLTEVAVSAKEKQ